MRDPRPIVLGWLLRGRNRLIGLDRYHDPRSYFGEGGLAEAEALCAEANRDLPAFVRPLEEVEPAELRRDGVLACSDGLRVEDWSFDSPMPSGDAANDRAQFRIYLPRAATPPSRVALFHHPFYQRSWEPWGWFLSDLIRRTPVALMAGPYHFGRTGRRRFPGEGVVNANPANLFLGMRQWCWDHEATVRALRDMHGLRPCAEIGYSFGAFQTLLLAAAGRIDVPIVSIASTNRYAYGMTHGMIGSELLRSMRQVGIDEERLAAWTESIQLERHVAPLRGKPVLYIRGKNDWVDPPPSLERLQHALEPTRALVLRGGHGGLLLRKRAISRETIRFLEETGALPAGDDGHWPSDRMRPARA